MKRQTRKVRKKLPMLWDEAMDFEVAIRPLPPPPATLDTEFDTKIIMFPLPERVIIYPQNPPPPMVA